MRLPTHCLLAALAIAPAAAQNYTFGTTVVDSSGLEGRVYLLSEQHPQAAQFLASGPGRRRLYQHPERLAAVLHRRLPQHLRPFRMVRHRLHGKVLGRDPGEYRFSLLSDDGAKLRIDDKLVIDNDGIHGADAISAAATLSRGTHRIEVAYFQGPRFTVALVLAIAHLAATGPSSTPPTSNRPAIPTAGKRAPSPKSKHRPSAAARN